MAIVNRLAGADDVCVCDFIGTLGLAQPTVSHHLKVLRKAGLVEVARKRGTWVYYRLVPEAVDEFALALGGSGERRQRKQAAARVLRLHRKCGALADGASALRAAGRRSALGGLAPEHEVHPEVVEAMAKLGLDVSTAGPRRSSRTTSSGRTSS